jgi:hypothetical protein
MKKKNIIRIIIAVALLLMIPLIAMQFTNEVNWTPADFIFAGFALLGAGLMYEFIASRAGDIVYRLAVGLAVGTALLLLWANLAVGIIGNEANPANLLYFGVLAVWFIGVAAAGFKPHEMSIAMCATAIAQALVPIIAFLIWRPEITVGVVEVVIVNAFFITLWVGAALLFRHANISGARWDNSLKPF